MITPISQATNSGVCVGSVPALAGTFFFRASEPAIASAGIGQPVAREEHRDAQRDVVERRVGAQPGEGAAVVVAGRGEGVQHLAEAVRPPGLKMVARPAGAITATAVPTSTAGSGSG